MRLGITLALLAVSLPASELAARAFIDQRGEIPYVGDPSTGYIPKANFTSWRGHINRHSMRADEPPDDRCIMRVMVFGDSVAFGADVEQSQLATSKVQNALTKSLGRPVWVGNASAGGWAPNNIRGYVNSRGWFDPDVIVFIFNSHDIAQINPIDQNATAETGAHSLALVTLLAEIKRWAANKAGTRTPIYPADKEAEAEQIMTSLVLDAVKRAPTLVVHNRIAGEYGPRPKGSQAQIEAPRGARLAMIARNVGAHYLDLGPLIPNPGPGYIDDIHLSEAGQKVMAQAIIKALEKDGHKEEDCAGA